MGSSESESETAGMVGRDAASGAGAWALPVQKRMAVRSRAVGRQPDMTTATDLRERFLRDQTVDPDSPAHVDGGFPARATQHRTQTVTASDRGAGVTRAPVTHPESQGHGDWIF